MQTKTLGSLDWLGFAIARMGGIAGAAKKMRASQREVRAWLSDGIGALEFARVVKISELADVPLSVLAKSASSAEARSAFAPVRGVSSVR